MQDQQWLIFLRKIGLCTAITKIKFKTFCRNIESGRCETSIRSASCVLLEYLFNMKCWHDDTSFLQEVSTIAFVIAEDLPRLCWIKPCTENTKVCNGDIKLTSLNRAAVFENGHLVWTVKPVVKLLSSSLPTELLHALQIKDVTICDVIENIVNISQTDFGDISNLPLQYRESSCHPVDSLFDVILRNFEFLQSNVEIDENRLHLEKLKDIPCIPVYINCVDDDNKNSVLVKPLQVVATEAEELKPFSDFLSSLPIGFYPLLNVLSQIGVYCNVRLLHIRAALEKISEPDFVLQHCNVNMVVKSKSFMSCWLNKLKNMIQLKMKKSYIHYICQILISNL